MLDNHSCCGAMADIGDLPQLGSEPVYPGPDYPFPKRKFGKSTVVERSCQDIYFRSWPWLTYEESEDKVYCFTCITAARQHQVLHKRGDPAFVRNGFSNWKDATVSFRKHEASAVHTDAVQATLAPKTCPDVAEMLSSELARQKADNRQCLLKILSNLRFLARQGLAIRGSGDDKDSNFTQLLTLRSEDDGRIVDWLSKKTDKYASHDMQNEMLQVMALSMLRDIAASIASSKFFTIMCDECTDSSNKEQVICIRWVESSTLDVHEDVIGMYHVDTISADSIVHALKDALLRINLSLSKCRGQCYDGPAI